MGTEGRIIVNPGTGPVEQATVEQAAKNMATFVLDLDLPWPVAITRDPEEGGWRLDREKGDGRWGFILTVAEEGQEDRAVTVAMPGCPLGQVRYLGLTGQNIWHYPRIYVADSFGESPRIHRSFTSWVWLFALDLTRGILAPDDPPGQDGGGEEDGG